MNDENKDIEYFKEKLLSAVGVPPKYFNTSVVLERIARRRKRIRTIKDIYNIDGKTRD
jgi:hypothetical protein